MSDMSHPADYGWGKTSDLFSENMTSDDFEIDYDELIGYLQFSKSNKDTLVDLPDLVKKLKNVNFATIYYKIMHMCKILRSRYIDMNDNIIKKLIMIIFNEQINKIIDIIRNHGNNEFSDMIYNKEKYDGLLMKIKTPTVKKPDKRTTIKIFQSGKINIDGANNMDEANYIYWWLNNFLVEHPNIIYDDTYIHDETDSEFSESDSV